MADEKRTDPTVPAKVAAVVVNAFVEVAETQDQPYTGGKIPVQFVLAWMRVVLAALSGDVSSVVESFRVAHPAARERLTWLLAAHRWCAACAAGERDRDGVHDCAIVVEETGQMCACTGCGPV